MSHNINSSNDLKNFFRTKYSIKSTMGNQIIQKGLPLASRSIADSKMNKKENKIGAQKHAPANNTQIKQLSYKNIYLQRRIQLLFKNTWRTSRKSLYRSKIYKFIPATLTTNQTSQINRMRHKMSFTLTTQYFWPLLWLLIVLIPHVESLEVTTSTYRSKETEMSINRAYSQPLSTNGQWKDDDTFHPFWPKDPERISHKLFTPSDQLRPLQPIDTDLKIAVSTQPKSHHYERNNMSRPLNTTLSQIYKAKQLTGDQTLTKENVKPPAAMLLQRNSNNFIPVKQQEEPVYHNKNRIEHRNQHNQHTNINVAVERNEIYTQDDLASDLKNLDELLVDYITNLFAKLQNVSMPGVLVQLTHNHSQTSPNEVANKSRIVRQTAATDANVRINLPRTLQTGRLLFLTGLKRVLWPVFMGLQVLKSLLIAMFIPAIIGSFTKLLGKGISTGSAPLFIRPMEPPQELDFRDNTLSFDDNNKFLITDDGLKANGPYTYNQADASQMNNEYMYDPSSSNNQLSYTRLGMNERQHQLMQDSYMSALQSIGSASFKNSGSLSSSSSGLVASMAKRPPPAAKVNTFQQFQNVPDSSLLLSNYDPFYSPLLSRLDSVFAQLKINSDKETCREKLICLMYANPAKYAPYSNLVSAQLSRELNELRKPTSDNPDILRFFKYMRAAKDGQDDIDCEKTFDKCTEFKDFENPAMVSTYHDINKLVQARKFPGK